MSYRQLKPHHRGHRVLQDTTTKNLTLVQNGATANLAIPCWYCCGDLPQHVRPHRVDCHDHIGWPNPEHPDHSCQDAHIDYIDSLVPINRYDHHKRGWYPIRRHLDMSKFFPIHLKDEGYTSVDVTFVNKPTGLVGSGTIDDYIVRFTLEPRCIAAIEEDIDVPYAVFVNGTLGKRKARDVVAKGVLRILAGPIS